jgi:hypothetical protein
MFTTRQVVFFPENYRMSDDEKEVNFNQQPFAIIENFAAGVWIPLNLSSGRLTCTLPTDGNEVILFTVPLIRIAEKFKGQGPIHPWNGLPLTEDSEHENVSDEENEPDSWRRAQAYFHSRVLAKCQSIP